MDQASERQCRYSEACADVRQDRVATVSVASRKKKAAPMQTGAAGKAPASRYRGGAGAILEQGLGLSDDWVLVHDAARPGLSVKLVEQLIESVTADPKHVGGILALPLADTLKRQADQQVIAQTLPRDGLWLAQTPQMFRLGLLCEVLRKGIAAGADLTDEASAFEREGYQPLLVMGDIQNLKVTYPSDWDMMTQLLIHRRA